VNQLFSNLVVRDRQLKHQPGSIIGCTALVAGTTVGAGILALPAVTLPAGIVPSSILLVAVWLYALVTGFLLVEVNLKTICSLGNPSSGLLAMVECSLGKTAAKIASLAYLFLHYALLVAYVARGGEIILSSLQSCVGHSLPAYLGVAIFAGIFGSLIYWGSDRSIQKFNNIFVAIVMGSFISLLLLGVERVNISNFNYQNWSILTPAIPIMLVALFYHNIIPVVTSELEGNFSKIRFCLVVGSLIPLAMFLAWNAVILGGVSPAAITDIATLDPIALLRQGTGGKWLGIIVSVFSEVAIATSFIGFIYGLRDFYNDAWQITDKDPKQRSKIYITILLPTLILAILNPTIFFTALDYAGTFSISILGGIIPVLMAWKQRYKSSEKDLIGILVPGGKITLIAIIIISFGVICQQFV
jgi:tyrosine-specific transport protein